MHITELHHSTNSGPNMVARNLPGHRADYRRRMIKRRRTGKNAITMTKVLLSKKGWRHASFEGPKGGDPSGIVDLVALKVTRNKKSHLRDRVRVFFFQVKGKEKVNPEEKQRLQMAVRRAEVRWAYSEKPESKMPKITSQVPL